MEWRKGTPIKWDELNRKLKGCPLSVAEELLKLVTEAQGPKTFCNRIEARIRAIKRKERRNENA